MSLVRDIAWEPCLLEPGIDRDLEAQARAEFGSVNPGTRYFSASPWFFHALSRLGLCLLQRVHLPHGLADQIGLVVSQTNSCRYCFAAQRMLMRLTGYPQERIDQLERGLSTGDIEPRVQAVLHFARRVSRSDPLPTGADLAALREHGWSADEIREIVGSVIVHGLFNRASTLAALPPENFEALPDRWYMRLFRPLAARKARSLHGQVAAAWLGESQKSGPFAAIVASLDGQPAAIDLRNAVDALWQAPELGARRAALVFAVVARALGVAGVEAEAVALAGAAGVSREECDEILAHLSSPGMPDAERAVLALARETVWVQPSALQRRTRELSQQLPETELIAVIAATSLANAVSRLAFYASETG